MTSKNYSAWVIAAMAMSFAAVVLAADEALWLEKTVDAKIEPADKKWVPRQTFVLNPTVAARTMSRPKLDKYGGRMDRQGKATDFFRVEERGDRWQMVDPEGCDFICVGVNDVAMSATQNGDKALKQRFGTPENWAIRTAELLASHGFNTLACESDFATFRKAGCRLAYTPNLYWMSGYGKQRGGTYQASGHTGYPKGCIFVFDPGFEEYCDAAAKKLVELKDDPWLLGYFSDNELPLSGKVLSAYLSLPESDPGCQAAKKWFAERVGGNDRKPTPEDEEAFLEVVTDRYHRIVRAAMKKYDPNHLYLGSRTHGDCYKSPAVMRAYGRNVDIMSINYYRAWSPDKELLAMWRREGKRPFMITEWYAKGEDSGLANTTGWGWLVKTQAERGYFYQTFTRGLLADPNCVGWHWFKYMDNDPTDTTMDPSNLDSNKGIVSMVYEPYDELLGAMKVMNAYVYPLADSPGQANSEVPVPSCDRIDYAHPDVYLPLNAHFGNKDHILKIAAAISGKTPEEKLVSIYNWIHANLVYKADAPYEWRDFDRLVGDGNFGGCADYSVVFGALSRACGIPTVWVKTLDADWIREFKTSGKEGTWSGHVFLEIFLHDHWLLLNDTELVLYENYDPKMRILPGNRYAYDKGGDPYDLVLSSRWELWKAETRAYFRDFDLAKLPVGKGKDLMHGTTVGATGASSAPTKYPAAYVFFSEKTQQSAKILCETLYPKLTRHLTSRPHSAEYYRTLFTEWAKPDQTLIVLLLTGEKDRIPAEYQDLLPKSYADLEAEANRKGAARYDGESRGLHLVVLVAKDSAELTSLIKGIQW